MIPDYETWVENNEDEVRDAYIGHLTERGELENYVFFWDNNADRLIDWKMSAEKRWQDFLQVAYESACNRLPEREEYEDR